MRDHQRDNLLGGIDKKSAAVPFHALRSQPLSQFVAVTPKFCAYETRRPADSPAAGVRFLECADGSRWSAAARHASRHAETLRRPPPTFVLPSRLRAPRILSEPGSQILAPPRSQASRSSAPSRRRPARSVAGSRAVPPRPTTCPPPVPSLLRLLPHFREHQPSQSPRTPSHYWQNFGISADTVAKGAYSRKPLDSSAFSVAEHRVLSPAVLPSLCSRH